MDLISRHAIEAFIEAISIFYAGFGDEAVAPRLRFPMGTVIASQYQHLHGLLLGLADVGARSYSSEWRMAAVETHLAGKKETGSLRGVWHFGTSSRGVSATRG
jgi:hypothetical protein